MLHSSYMIVNTAVVFTTLSYFSLYRFSKMLCRKADQLTDVSAMTLYMASARV